MPNLPYQTAGWDTHGRSELRVLDYPLFEGCPSHYTILRTFTGPSTTYAAEALDTADADDATAYLVRQGPLTDGGGLQVRYQRLYSTIPASWVDLESYAYTYPGYEAGASSASVAVNGMAYTGSNLILTTASDSGAVSGDAVTFGASYIRNGVAQYAAFQGTAVATTDGSQVTIVRSLPGSGAFSSVSGVVMKLLAGAPFARSLVVGSRVVHDYALSSDANLDADLPLSPVFSPVDAVGDIADYLGTGTTPTAAVYRTMVNSGAQIVVESIRRRYLGNIYVRQTRMIPAR